MILDLISRIGDGDVPAALNAVDPESDIDLLMGIGAAPEGVITATALRGLNATFKEDWFSRMKATGRGLKG